MYCRKCGKWIDYEAEICTDCQQTEELFKVENEQPAQPAQNEQYQYFFGNNAQQPYAQQPYAQQPYAQQPYAQQPYAQPVQSQDKGSRMEGFGFALAGTIIGFFAFLFSYLLLIFSAVGGMGLIMFPFALSTAIFAMVSGTKSLNKSKECTRAGKVKPIATFILGIVNVVLAGLSFFFIVLTIMILAVAL